MIASNVQRSSRLMARAGAMLLGACVTLSLAGEPPLPDGPASRKLQLWIAAFNADEPDAMEKHVAGHFAASITQKRPAADIAGQFKSMRAQTGKLKIESASEDGMKVRAKARSESTGVILDLSASVEADPPHGLLGIGIKPAS